LVLVNGPNFRDPDLWKPFTPSDTILRTLFAPLRRAADSVYFCPTDPEKPVLFEYTWRDLRIIAGYRNRAGRSLIAVELDPRAWTCDAMRDSDWDVHWFLLEDQPLLLGVSLELLDAGDYDADGKSEVLFWHANDEDEGYTLFTADFRKRIDRWWTKH